MISTKGRFLKEVNIEILGRVETNSDYEKKYSRYLQLACANSWQGYPDNKKLRKSRDPERIGFVKDPVLVFSCNHLHLHIQPVPPVRTTRNIDQ